MRLVTGLVKDRLLGCFTTVSLARVVAWNRTWGPGIKVGYVEKLGEWQNVMEEGGQGSKL